MSEPPSETVIVWGPAVFSVTEKDPVPFAIVELVGNIACASELVNCAVPE